MPFSKLKKLFNSNNILLSGLRNLNKGLKLSFVGVSGLKIQCYSWKAMQNRTNIPGYR
jgi:hypothetical protein